MGNSVGYFSVYYQHSQEAHESLCAPQYIVSCTTLAGAMNAAIRCVQKLNKKIDAEIKACDCCQENYCTCDKKICELPHEDDVDCDHREPMAVVSKKKIDSLEKNGSWRGIGVGGPWGRVEAAWMTKGAGQEAPYVLVVQRTAQMGDVPDITDLLSEDDDEEEVDGWGSMVTSSASFSSSSSSASSSETSSSSSSETSSSSSSESDSDDEPPPAKKLKAGPVLR